MTTQEITILICAIIAVYSAIRVVAERKTLEKLPFLNVLSFAIAGSLALLLPDPLTILAAAAYFVGTTLESNAIASKYAGGVKENE